MFLGQHNVKSIRAPIIALGPESELGQLYGAGSKIKQKSLELHQDRVEETRLDCLALEIVKWKKEVATHRLQSEENLAKEKEAVDALAAIIRQTRQDSTIASENEKKLKRDKLSKGGILFWAMRTFQKLSGDPQTLTSLSVS